MFPVESPSIGGKSGMSKAPALRLVALDEEDLAIVSAHVQDAVLLVGDLKWMQGAQRFVAAMNRFAWEAAGDGSSRGRYTRRRAVLHFDRVTAVQSFGIAPSSPQEALSLLAVGFETGDAPSGQILLYFAGGAAIRLTVECIEAQISDLGAEWAARSLPVHDFSETGGAPVGQA